MALSEQRNRSGRKKRTPPITVKTTIGGVVFPGVGAMRTSPRRTVQLCREAPTLAIDPEIAVGKQIAPTQEGG